MSKAASIRDVPLEASIIFDKAVVLRNSTKETPCIMKETKNASAVRDI
jgi:hypothetical protein